MSAGTLAGAVLDRRTPPPTVVDAHAHLGPYSLFFIPEQDAAGLVRVMDRCGVARTLLSSHLAIQCDAAAGNDATAAAVAAYPDRLAGYLVVNPWQDPVAELARWAGDPRFVGIKLHPSLHEYRLTGPRYRPVWEYAAATRCPVLTHTTTGLPYDDPAMVGEIAERYPDVTILAGHSGLFRAGFDDAIEVARRHPHVLLELCGSFMHGDEISRMVGEVGAGQVVFGSDAPFIDLRMSLGRVVFARLDEADRDAVLGGTMRRVLAAAGH